MTNTGTQKSRRAPSDEYTTRFARWDDQAWVRRKPRRTTPFEPDKYFYSRDLAVLFHADDVARASDKVQRDILTLHLFTYLEFTVWLEMGPVNEVCDLLSRPFFLPWLPVGMKDDAMKIYVDEGAHAEMSHELAAAVSDYTGLTRLRVGPQFLNVLDDIVESHDDEFEDLLKLMFVSISETLITGTLTHLPKDSSVQRAVRELAEDHASDEGRHHAYFRDLFGYVWPRFPRDLRLILGSALPSMVLAFLEPDRANLQRTLERFPDVFAQPAITVAEAIDSPTTRQGILASARPTLQMLVENKVMSEPAIRASFEAAQLVPNA